MFPGMIPTGQTWLVGSLNDWYEDDVNGNSTELWGRNVGLLQIYIFAKNWNLTLHTDAQHLHLVSQSKINWNPTPMMMMVRLRVCVCSTLSMAVKSVSKKREGTSNIFHPENMIWPHTSLQNQTLYIQISWHRRLIVLVGSARFGGLLIKHCRKISENSSLSWNLWDW